MRRVILLTIATAVAFVPKGLSGQQETDARAKAAAVAAVRFMVEQKLIEKKTIEVAGFESSQVTELASRDERIRAFVWRNECGATVASATRARAACGLQRTDAYVEVLRIGRDNEGKRRVLVIAFMPSGGLIRSDDGLDFLELEIELTEANGRWISPRIVGGRLP